MAGLFHTPELIKSVIQGQALTRLFAFELNGDEKIDLLEGKPTELCDRLDELVQWVPGAFRVECGASGDVVDKGGNPGRHKARAVFVWRLMGEGGRMQAQAADAANRGAPPVPGAIPPGGISASELAARVEAERLKSELQRMRECPHGVLWSDKCRACDAEEGDDDDDDDEPEAGAGSVDVDKTRELITLFRDVVREFRTPGRIQPKSGPVTGAAPVSDEMTDDDRAAWRAMQRMRAGNEQEFEQYRKWLLENYGEQSASDGK